MPETTQSAVQGTAIDTEQLLQHWLGHRRLTRRVIEAFPEDQIFRYRVGPMRPFGELVQEFLAMDVPMLEELVSGAAREYELPEATTKDDLLRAWDQRMEEIPALWKQLPAALFQETRTVFGRYTSSVYDLLWYVIDNEIHHRGQGYVYLRALGIEPPAFYER